MKITDYLAIYGAALSTAVFMWTVGKARRRLTVRMTPGMQSGDDDTAGFYAVVGQRFYSNHFRVTPRPNAAE